MKSELTEYRGIVPGLTYYRLALYDYDAISMSATRLRAIKNGLETIRKALAPVERCGRCGFVINLEAEQKLAQEIMGGTRFVAMIKDHDNKGPQGHLHAWQCLAAACLNKRESQGWVRTTSEW